MLLPALDLLLGAIQLGVVHRVGAEAICAQLEEAGPATVTHHFRRAVGRVLHREHVHAVGVPGWHLVGCRLQRQVGLRLRALERRPHRVEVVLAHEQNRQLPQSREVHRLVELALRDRALTEEACGHAPAALQLVGQCEPDGQRQAAADDRVAAVEAAWGVEDVHRAAAAAAAALDAAEHLGHDRLGRDAAGQRVAVLAVGGHDRVVRVERLHAADGHRLLADVQVQEAADLGRAVQLDAALLEAPDAEHLAIEVAARASLTTPPTSRCRPPAHPARAPSTAGA